MVEAMPHQPASIMGARVLLAFTVLILFLLMASQNSHIPMQHISLEQRQLISNQSLNIVNHPDTQNTTNSIRGQAKASNASNKTAFKSIDSTNLTMIANEKAKELKKGKHHLHHNKTRKEHKHKNGTKTIKRIKDKSNRTKVEHGKNGGVVSNYSGWVNSSKSIFSSVNNSDMNSTMVPDAATQVPVFNDPNLPSGPLKKWPEVVGMNATKAEAIIEKDMNYTVHCQIIPQNAFVTADFFADRVRIFVWKNYTVARPPMIG